jgi:hypothetical protein
VIVFDRVSLVIFAVWAALGMAAPFALTAKARMPALVLVALLAAAWFIVVLVSAAVMLR